MDVKKIRIGNKYLEGMDCVAISVNERVEKIAIVRIYRRPGVRLQQDRIKKIIKVAKEYNKKENGKDIRSF